MPRLKTKTTGLRTRAAFDRAINEIAEIAVRLRQLEADRDERIQAIREETDPAIQTTRDRRDALLTLAEDYALDNRYDLFPKGKSAATSLAEFGLRIGQPTLKTLNRRWTWIKVMQAVKDLHSGRFIRTKETLDKEAIRAQLGGDPTQLAVIGCRIEQTESFWVEPKEKPEEV